jgi:histidinol-phosphatase (PHP family)
MNLKNKIVKSNYHTHTYLCNHADGNVEDYVKKAIELGFSTLGMSDHAPFIFLKDRSVRMGIEDYPTYLKDLEDAIRKYSNQIKIYIGLEIEYFRSQKNHYKHLLETLDYLILGQHYVEINNRLMSVYDVRTIDQMKAYVINVIEAIETGYFKMICHPDIFLLNLEEINPNDEEEIMYLSKLLIESAEKNKVALEINANGIRRGKLIIKGEVRYQYPRKEFWELVSKSKVKVIISSDAHHPDLLFDEAMIEAYNFAKHLGIEVEEELVID